ncbi:glycosyltransferase family 1 protein [Mesorhizobium sp. KR2-14]|uniref:glycosyltransferase family 4 protein n=1 Tax=Mesorhizobium sp. KR2-14 TaxID=3156610 RepID=UPI0032B543FF
MGIGPIDVPAMETLLRDAGPEHPAPGPATAQEETTAHRKRCWTINGDFVTLNPNGVARYAREVTLALDALIAEGHPLARGLLLDLVAPRNDESLPLRAIGTRVVPEFRTPRLPQFWVQAQLPRHVPGGLLSFCNLAPIALSRHIVCVHDMHTRLMPESYGRLFRWAHRLILPVLGRRAARITTVSELSRLHLVKYGIARSDKITVTYNGSDHAARWDAARSTLAASPERSYVLCLGRSQKYKNVDLLLRLAPLLDDMGLDLWMAGEVDPAAIAAVTQPAPPNLRLLGRISDDDFKQALTGALCFLFPSRIEGFGLPAVEAMVAGCPVVASTSPCLPEVCGEAALYADPDDVEEWAEAVALIRSDAGMRRRLIEAGKARAQRYTWRSIAESYLKLMMQVDIAFAQRAARGRRAAASSGAN